jgi:ketosteroid isomerase-like protein
MSKALSLIFTIVLTGGVAFAQNTNSSTTVRQRTTTNTNQSNPPAAAAQRATGSEAVLAAFNSLLDGIRKADLNAVMAVYLNSPRLIHFNYNGTVTKSWEQVRKNRESSYPEIKDVKLEVRDVSVEMLGRDAAVISCLWTQSLNYKGTPETASGRMTLVFRRTGTGWKAIHLHSSPDTPNPASIPPSEQKPAASPSPTP